jgi:hypothetical protein
MYTIGLDKGRRKRRRTGEKSLHCSKTGGKERCKIRKREKDNGYVNRVVCSHKIWEKNM